ncbi:hypothetical protein ACS0TY_018468 [Phlomoides rotata]
MDEVTNMQNVGQGRKKQVSNSRRVWTYVEEKELSMLGVSGIGLNNTTFHIEALPEVWAAHIKADPIACGLKNKTFSFYSDWDKIFGNDRATGNDSQSYVDLEQDDLPQTPNNPDSTKGARKTSEFPNTHEFSTTDVSSFNIGDSSSATMDKGKGLKRKHIYELAVQFINTMEFLTVESRVEVAQYLCNFPKDMDLFYSLPDNAKTVLVNRILKKLENEG